MLESIRLTGQRYGDQIRRVFLADGDALVLPTRRLLSILEAIRIPYAGSAPHFVATACRATCARRARPTSTNWLPLA